MLPRSTVSTRGTNLLALTLETEMKGAWLLCMQAFLCTGIPFSRQPLGYTFGHTTVVGSLALVADAVSLGTCKTEAIIGDQFEDFR